MRILQAFIVVVVVVFATSCSRRPTAPSTANMLTNSAAMSTFMTNSVEVLQARYEEVRTNLQELSARLDQFQSSDQTNSRAYLDAKQEYRELMILSGNLDAKIRFDKGVELERRAKGEQSSH
jgi:hypothetical protein